MTLTGSYPLALLQDWLGCFHTHCCYLLGVAEVPPEEVVHPVGCLLWVAGHSLDINFEVPF